MYQTLRLPEALQIFCIYIFGHLVLAADPFLLPPLMPVVAILGQIIAAYLWNDFFDHESDAQNPRKHPITDRQLNVIRGLAIFMTGLSLTFSWQTHTDFFLTVLAMNILGYIYSAPPVRLKARAPFSQLVHFISGVMYFLGFSLHLQGIEIAGVFLALFWGFFLLSASMANEMIDHLVDQKVGDNTLVGKIGAKTSSYLLIAWQLSALFFLSLASYSEKLISPLVFVFASVIVYVYFWRKIKVNDSHSVQRFREIYRLLFAIVVCCYLLEFGLSRNIFRAN